MLKEELRFQTSAIFEGMTSIRALLKGQSIGVNDRPIEKVYFDKTRRVRHEKEWHFLSRKGEVEGFSVEEVDPSFLETLTVGSSHGGIVALCGERSIPPFQTVTALPEKGFFAMIEGIEDPYNFGYAIRSLYACGVSGLIVTERNWMTAAGVVARSSAGASEMLPVYTGDSLSVADAFHEKGYRIITADLRTDKSLTNTQLSLPACLIVGGEKRGISRALLEKSDIVVKIPYGRDFPAALSAASAATILGWEIFRQNS